MQVVAVELSSQWSSGGMFNSNLLFDTSNTEVSGPSIGSYFNVTHYLDPRLYLNIDYGIDGAYFNSLASPWELNQRVSINGHWTGGPGYTIHTGISHSNYDLHYTPDSFNESSTAYISTTLYLTQELGFDVIGEYTKYNYPRYPFLFDETSLGGVLHLPLNTYFSSDLGYRFLTGVSEDNSNDYRGNILSASIYSIFSPFVFLELGFNETKKIYTNTNTSKQRSISSSIYYQWTDQIQLSASYTHLSYSMTDQESLTNQIASIQASWSFDVGSPYPNNHNTHSTYLFATINDLIDNGHYQSAKHALEILLFDDPTFPNAHFEYGFVLTKLGQHKKAVTALETAILSDDTQFEAYYLLASNYIKTNQFRQAKLVFEALVEMDPSQKHQRWLTEFPY